MKTLFFSIKPHHIPNEFVDKPALPSVAVRFDCLLTTPPVDLHWLHTLQGDVGIKLQRSGVKEHLINLQLHLLYKFALETLFVTKQICSLFLASVINLSNGDIAISCQLFLPISQ